MGTLTGLTCLHLNKLLNNRVDIKVQIDNRQPVLVRLNLKETLSNIRERFENDSSIKMDNTLSFAKKKGGDIINYEYADEEKTILKNIVEKKEKILYLTKSTKIIDVVNVGMTVQIDKLQVFIILNLKDKLSNIRRKILKQNSLIQMDDALLFAKKDAKGHGLIEIVRDEEEKIILEEITSIGTDNQILYLMKISESNYSS